VTIACTTKEFFTDKWHYTIIDAPGHRLVVVVSVSAAAVGKQLVGLPALDAPHPVTTQRQAPCALLPLLHPTNRLSPDCCCNSAAAPHTQGFHQEHDLWCCPGRRVPADGAR
jgi:hypothetical protein